jgi:Acetyltransferase (GNAT) domain
VCKTGVRFERLDLTTVDWDALDSFADRTIFQTRAWLDFIAATQRVEPVVAALREGGELRGYFTGGLLRKFGLPMLGSPFPGWTSSYLGFNLLPGVSRGAALGALARFAFDELKCVHLELMDRRLCEAEARAAGFEIAYLRGYEVNLARAEAAILAGFKDDCRWRIRKAARAGVAIEEAAADGFADEYYDQLVEVFAKRGLTPTYDRARVRALIAHVHPTGRLLLLRARNAAGRAIATGLFPAFNDTAYFWGGASWRADQTHSPNEAIQWRAMQYWKARGVTHYDMGGGGAYKAKYGGDAIAVPWVHKSKYAVLARQRDRAKQIYWLMKRTLGRFG